MATAIQRGFRREICFRSINVSAYFQHNPQINSIISSLLRIQHPKYIFRKQIKTDKHFRITNLFPQEHPYFNFQAHNSSQNTPRSWSSIANKAITKRWTVQAAVASRWYRVGIPSFAKTNFQAWEWTCIGKPNSQISCREKKRVNSTLAFSHPVEPLFQHRETCKCAIGHSCYRIGNSRVSSYSQQELRKLLKS